MFNRFKSEDAFERLEREAKNDFQLLAELGPSYFGADHLMELHSKVRDHIVLFDRRQRLAIILGGTGVGWSMLTIPAFYFGYKWIGVATSFASVLCFVGFFGLLFWQKKQFESKGELDYTKRVIEEELRHRAQKKREQKL